MSAKVEREHTEVAADILHRLRCWSPGLASPEPQTSADADIAWLTQRLADLESAAYQRGLDAGRKEGAEPWERLAAHCGETGSTVELSVDSYGSRRIDYLGGWVFADDAQSAAKLACSKLALPDPPSAGKGGTDG